MPSLIPTNSDGEKEALDTRYNRVDQLEKNPAFIWFIEKVLERKKQAAETILNYDTDMMKYPIIKAKYHQILEILDIIPQEKRVVTQLLKDKQQPQLTNKV